VRIVADASVVVEAWINDSLVASECRGILSSSESCVPDLVFSEVGHVFRTQERLRGVDLTHQFESFTSSPWSEYHVSEYAPIAWPLRHDITFYDACYVGLAMALDIPLVTLDRKLAGVARRYCEVIIPGE
jgi:predicted nucleic acid-binding protein